MGRAGRAAGVGSGSAARARAPSSGSTSASSGLIGSHDIPREFWLRARTPAARAVTPLEALGELGELALERAIALPAIASQRAVLERGLNRAAGLGLVAAIGEAAVLRQ